MVLALELTQHVAEGTSLLVIVPTALVGAVAHHKRGYVDTRAAAFLAVSGIVGAIAGALGGLEISGELLQRLFAGLIAVAGVRLVLDGLRARSA